MKKIMQFLLIMFLLINTLFINAQNIGAGASVMYNFQTEGLGAGVRVSVFPNKKLSFVPQFSYFFMGFSDFQVKEYTAGLALEYKFIQKEKINVYALAHGGYNHWINYFANTESDFKPNNWNAELGIGISTNHCLRPFIEYRYNFKFLETHLDFGFLYIFGCKKSGRSADRCAAY